MTTEVVTVDPETEVSEVAAILLAHRISGAPVVDDKGHVVGMISEADLMRRARTDPGYHWWLSFFSDGTKDFVRNHGTQTRDVMTHDVVSIGKDVTLAEIARILESNDIKRVPVVEGGRLAGIVSRSDVLRGLASLKTAGNRGAPGSDLPIQQEIVKLIKENTSVSLRAVSIIVEDGMVSLWGTVESEKECAAVRAAAETIVGAGKVYDNLNMRAEAL